MSAVELWNKWHLSVKLLLCFDGFSEGRGGYQNMVIPECPLLSFASLHIVRTFWAQHCWCWLVTLSAFNMSLRALFRLSKNGCHSACCWFFCLLQNLKLLSTAVLKSDENLVSAKLIEQCKLAVIVNQVLGDLGRQISLYLIYSFRSCLSSQMVGAKAGHKKTPKVQ